MNMPNLAARYHFVRSYIQDSPNPKLGNSGIKDVARANLGSRRLEKKLTSLGVIITIKRNSHFSLFILSWVLFIG